MPATTKERNAEVFRVRSAQDQIVWCFRCEVWTNRANPSCDHPVKISLANIRWSLVNGLYNDRGGFPAGNEAVEAVASLVDDLVEARGAWDRYVGGKN